MSVDDGFLSRWSRRKLATHDPAPPAEPGAAKGSAPVAAEPPPAAGAALSEKEIAALPRIEDITAETDLLPFLREGVPAFLRKAALRQMWSSDPTIRDFVGEARDYAWDWNVPGGVPVSGPLLPSDDVPAMLARLYVAPTSPETSLDGEIHDEARDITGEVSEIVAGEEGAVPDGTDEGRPVPLTEAVAPSEPAPAPSGATRRHGGAVPV